MTFIEFIREDGLVEVAPSSRTSPHLTPPRLIVLLFYLTFQCVRNIGGRSVQRKVFQVSIHAPARGGTPPEYDPSAVFNVSIHAPVRGATNSITI